jgi:uncharacterized protein
MIQKLLAGCILTAALIGSPASALSCAGSASLMERLICTDPALKARDDAMNALYGAALDHGGLLVARDQQRRWLRSARRCKDKDCLVSRYDIRNGELIRADMNGRVTRRFHMQQGDLTGDLRLVFRPDWITYDVVQTRAATSASSSTTTARLTGTAAMSGLVAVDHHGLCELTLQHNPNGSWSVGTRHCFRGDQATLNGLYR